MPWMAQHGPTVKRLRSGGCSRWLPSGRRPFLADGRSKRGRGFVAHPLALILALLAGPQNFPGMAAAGPSGAYVRDAGGLVCLGNPHLELRFSPYHGELVSVIHKKSGLDLKQEKQNAYKTVWGMSWLTAAGQHPYTDNARSGQSFKHNATRLQNSMRLDLTWTNLQLDNGQIYPAEVHVAITLPDNSPMSLWRMEIKNGGPHAVDLVSFPLIAGIKELGSDGADDCLVYPSREGRLYHNPSRNLSNLQSVYPSSFLNMQFAAYYDRAGGFYLACQDDQAMVKEFNWFRHKPEWACMAIVHHPPETKFGGGFTLSYDVALGVFDGDWYAAAEIYRKWAAGQWWAKEKLKERDIPAWLPDTGISSCFVAAARAAWKPQDTSLAEIADFAKSHRNFFGSPLLVELWGWENKGAWSWGDYFPPLEGWSKFNAMVSDLHANGSRLKTFIGTTSVRMNTDLWTSQEPLPYAVLDGSGKPRHYGQEVAMCIGTPYWQNKLRETTLTLIEHGVDMVQMDSFAPVPTQQSCFDKAHRHPSACGSWMTRAWLQTLADIRGKGRRMNPGVAFTSEGIAEVYLPHLDLAKHWRDVFAEVEASIREKDLWNGTSEIIPAFNYVYHDNILVMGEYLLGLAPGRHSEYNWLCLGRMLVWGEIPLNNNWMPVESPAFDKQAAKLLKEISQARTTYAKDFLVYGRMQPPPRISSPVTAVPLPKDLGDPPPVMTVPSLMHSAWRASDGCIGLVLFNLANEPISFKLPISRAQLGLSPGIKYSVHSVRNGTFGIVLAELSQDTNLALSIQSKEILVLIVGPANGERAIQANIKAGAAPPGKASMQKEAN